ncbi:hypothetical protein V8E52_008093, partial [Russula decolorans]
MSTDADANDDRAELSPVRVESTWKQVIDVYRGGILADCQGLTVGLSQLLLNESDDDEYPPTPSSLTKPDGKSAAWGDKADS